MKLKQKFLRFCEVLMMLFVIWTMSKLPAEYFTMAEWGAYGILGVVLCVWLCIFIYKYRKVSLAIFLLLFGPIVWASSLDDCEQIEDAAEQNLCRYEVLEDNYSSELCSYMKSFNPRKALKDEPDVRRLEEQVQNADELLAASRLVPAAYKEDLNVSACNMPETDDLKGRINAWHSNNTAYCCAFAMQQLNQIYASQHPKTLVKTVLGVLAEDSMSCWPCDVIYLMSQVINTVVWNAQPFMAAAGMFLVQWVFVFWLLFQVAFVFMGRVGAGDFFKALLIQLLLVMLVSLILVPVSMQVGAKKRADTFLDDTYDWVISPPFQLVLGTGIRLTQTLLNGKHNFTDRLIEEGLKSPNPTDRENARRLKRSNYCENWRAIEEGSMYEKLLIKERMSGYDMNTAKGRILNEDLTGGMLCLTQAAFTGLSSIGAAGSVLSSYSLKNAIKIPLFPASIPIFKALFVGLTLQLVCWFIGLEVAFQLMDVVLRLAFVLILSPVFIASAAFSVTREYSIIACRFFWGALMRFIEVAMAVAIMLPFFFSSLGGSDGENLIKAMVAPASKKYVENLLEAFSSGGFYLILMIGGVGWLAFHMLKVTQIIFEEIFNLKEVAAKSDRFFNVGQGAMQGVMTGARQTVGAVTPLAKNLGSLAANSKAGRFVGGKARAWGQGAVSKVQSWGGSIASSRAGQAVARFGRNVGAVASRAGRWAANTRPGRMIRGAANGVGRAARWAANTRAGQFAGRAAGAIGRAAGRGMKAGAKGLGKAAKRGIKNFFFMPQDEEEQDE